MEKESRIQSKAHPNFICTSYESKSILEISKPKSKANISEKNEKSEKKKPLFIVENYERNDTQGSRKEEDRESSDEEEFVPSQINMFETVQRKLSKDTEKLLVYLRSHNYLFADKGLTLKKRLKVTDWLMDLSAKTLFGKATFYRAVGIFDVFFSRIKRKIPPEDLQLYATACLILGMKLEEVNIKTLDFFVKATNNTYSAERIEQAEQEILRVLGCKLLYASVLDWANYVASYWDCLRDNGKHSLHRCRDDSQVRNYVIHTLHQICDAVILDYTMVLLHPLLLVLAVLYFVEGISHGIFTQQNIVNGLQEGPVISNYSTVFFGVAETFFGVDKNTLSEILWNVSYYFRVCIISAEHIDKEHLRLTQFMPYSVARQLQNYFGTLQILDKSQEIYLNQIGAIIDMREEAIKKKR